ncbi:MAG: GNAT family N-acetyltransferase [Labilithrix sp.]|nr:GNAT family N-acetyltransferase [Labilithrix sp.]MCW5811401.1 GNAT family N-acetyltransferase [Labilithrix sp.]
MTPATLRLAVPPTSRHAELCELVGHVYGIAPERVGEWFAKAGHEHLRVMLRDGDDAMVGSLLEVPMAQYFGGRSVPTMGVAGVAVAPIERGRGVGARMMVEMLRSARDRGFPLSTLYPATVTLYRRAGYERAGARFAIKVDPRHVEVLREPGVVLAEVTGAPEELRSLYARAARRTNGFLDRGPYCWDRVVHPRNLTTKTFTITHEGRLEGYVVLAHVMGAYGFPTRVDVRDLAAITPRATRAILRLLVEYRSLADEVKWEGGVNDVFANLLPERHVTISLIDYFMVRVIDVAAALAARGFPPNATGGFTLELDDRSMPENSGRYGVALAEGRATVTRGGTNGARVATDERGLAALYSGFTPAHVLADAGWLEADEATCALLDAWLAGPTPTMRDAF